MLVTMESPDWVGIKTERGFMTGPFRPDGDYGGILLETENSEKRTDIFSDRRRRGGGMAYFPLETILSPRQPLSGRRMGERLR